MKVGDILHCSDHKMVGCVLGEEGKNTTAPGHWIWGSPWKNTFGYRPGEKWSHRISES